MSGGGHGAGRPPRMLLLLPAASRSSTAPGAHSRAFGEALPWAAAGCCIRSGLGLLAVPPSHLRVDSRSGRAEKSCVSLLQRKGVEGWGWGVLPPLVPLVPHCGDPRAGLSRELATFLPLVPSPENCSETDAGPRDHMMRQTPVCPTRQWELPPAFIGTITSDLKFLERKRCSRLWSIWGRRKGHACGSHSDLPL